MRGMLGQHGRLLFTDYDGAMWVHLQFRTLGIYTMPVLSFIELVVKG